MRKAGVVLAAGVAMAVLVLGGPRLALNTGPGLAFGADIQVSMPQEAVGFNGTLVGEIVKPVAQGCFTIKVVKVLACSANNSTKMTAAALTETWKDKYDWCGPAKGAAALPPLKVGDLVVLTCLQNEMHLRYSKATRQEGGRSGGSTPAATPSERTRDLQNVPCTKINVEYALVGDKHLMVAIYRPKDFRGRLPLVVWIYGGAWRNFWTNDTRSLPGGNGVGLLVSHGYAVASVSHRLARSYAAGEKAYVFPAQIEDVKGAIRFLRANAEKYSLNADRIGVWGGSSGGHLAALLGTSGGVKDLEGTLGGNLDQSSRVQAVVDCSGPTDLAKLEASCAGFYGPGQSPPATLVGGPTAQHRDLVIKANPVTYVKKDAPPFLIAHGDKDNLVPIIQSQLLVDALKKVGVEVTFEVVKGVGHGGATAAQDEYLNRLVTEFFDKHVKGAAASRPAGGTTGR